MVKSHLPKMKLILSYITISVFFFSGMGLVYVNRKRLLFFWRLQDFSFSLAYEGIGYPRKLSICPICTRNKPPKEEQYFMDFMLFFLLPQSAAWQVPEKSVADVGQCVNNLGQYVPAHGKTRRGDHKKLILYLQKLSQFCELGPLKSHGYRNYHFP